ncbi:MAG: methyltransferase domain-containing protein [Bacillota bacterium]
MLETRQLAITLGDRNIRLAVAADLEALLGDLSDPDQVPCWADLWPAACGLARFIWSGPGLNGCSVLELGAGVGLPGVACGLKGAAVTFSDFQQPALELCAANARLNGLPGYKLLLEDWRTFTCRERFDLVLASDIAYEPRLLPHLEKVLFMVVKPGGTLMISHPGRPVTGNFVRQLLKRGVFSESVVVEDVVMDDPVLPRYQITIHLLRYKRLKKTALRRNRPLRYRITVY